MASANSKVVQDFMKCLQAAESSGDVKELAALFAQDADLSILTKPSSHAKTGGATQAGASQTGPARFWRQYLRAFDRVSSHFTNVIDDGRTAVLEWHSKGGLPMGLPIDYCGVSILEYEAGRITKFRTYYDSAAFLPHVATAKPYSQTAGVPRLTNDVSS